MAQRKRIKIGTLEASSNSLKNICAKRLIMQVRYKLGFPNQCLSINPIGIKKNRYDN
jgi:hypothetical protein